MTKCLQKLVCNQCFIFFVNEFPQILFGLGLLFTFAWQLQAYLQSSYIHDLPLHGAYIEAF